MESESGGAGNFHGAKGPHAEGSAGDGHRDEAAATLDALSADRHRLADRLAVPWALMAAFGALAAWWVGSAVTTTPGSGYEPPLAGWMTLPVALVIAHLVRRGTGIRFRALGARANGAMLAVLVACLLLFSVSLAAVSLGMAWLVGVMSLVAFGVTTWLSGVAYRSAVERVRRG